MTTKALIEARVLANCRHAHRVTFDEEYLALTADVVLGWEWVFIGKRARDAALDDIERVLEKSLAAGVHLRAVRFWLPLLRWRVRIAAYR